MYMVLVSFYTFLAMPILTSSPLVQDYVEKESMAKANSFGMMGLSLGVIVSLAGLFEVTLNMNPRYAFGLLSIIMILFAFFSLHFVSDVIAPSESKDNVFKKIQKLSV